MAYYRRRHHRRRRSFKKSYRRKSYRRRYRKSGGYGKIGVYFAELGAKVYISKHKWRVMHLYAKLIAHSIINRHAHHANASHMQVETALTQPHTRKVKVHKGEYKRLVNHIMCQMIKKNWYSLWYDYKNQKLTSEAQKVLQDARTHAHIHGTDIGKHIPGIPHIGKISLSSLGQDAESIFRNL